MELLKTFLKDLEFLKRFLKDLEFLKRSLKDLELLKGSQDVGGTMGFVKALLAVGRKFKKKLIFYTGNKEKLM